MKEILKHITYGYPIQDLVIPTIILTAFIQYCIYKLVSRSKSAEYKFLREPKSILFSSILILINIWSFILLRAWIRSYEGLNLFENFIFLSGFGLIQSSIFSYIEFIISLINPNSYVLNPIIKSTIKNKDMEIYNIVKQQTSQENEVINKISSMIHGNTKIKYLGTVYGLRPDLEYYKHEWQNVELREFETTGSGLHFYDIGLQEVAIVDEINIYVSKASNTRVRKKHLIVGSVAIELYSENEQPGPKVPRKKIIGENVSYIKKYFQKKITANNDLMKIENSIKNKYHLIPFSDFWYNNIMELMNLRMGFIFPNKLGSKSVKFIFGIYKVIFFGSFLVLLLQTMKN